MIVYFIMLAKMPIKLKIFVKDCNIEIRMSILRVHTPNLTIHFVCVFLFIQNTVAIAR